MDGGDHGVHRVRRRQGRGAAAGGARTGERAVGAEEHRAAGAAVAGEALVPDQALELVDHLRVAEPGAGVRRRPEVARVGAVVVEVVDEEVGGDSIRIFGNSPSTRGPSTRPS